jgi:hypothetical protein
MACSRVNFTFRYIHCRTYSVRIIFTSATTTYADVVICFYSSGCDMHRSTVGHRHLISTLPVLPQIQTRLLLCNLTSQNSTVKEGICGRAVPNTAAFLSMELRTLAHTKNCGIKLIFWRRGKKMKVFSYPMFPYFWNSTAFLEGSQASPGYPL